MTRPKLVIVEWLDSSSPIPEWRHLDNPPAARVILCLSVGWLLHDSDGVLMLAPNLGDINDQINAQASGFMPIPQSSIIRSIELRDPTEPPAAGTPGSES